MSYKHYRSDVDEYTSYPLHATAGRVYRPKSMRVVSAEKELNRIRAKLKGVEAENKAFIKEIGALPDKWRLAIRNMDYKLGMLECTHQLQAKLKESES